MRKRLIVIGAILFVAYGCTTTAPRPQEPEKLHGVASWYGQEFAGRTTANGEIFDPMLPLNAGPMLWFDFVSRWLCLHFSPLITRRASRPATGCRKQRSRAAGRARNHIRHTAFTGLPDAVLGSEAP